MTALNETTVCYMPIPAWDHLTDIPSVVIVEAEFRADSPYHVRLTVERRPGVDVPLDVLAAGLTGRAECAALATWPLDEEFVRWDVQAAGPVALRVPRWLLAWHLQSLPQIARAPDWDAFARACVEGAP
ncbi:hypothetical protein AB0L53_31545 [Nonomuraea sp. NPDC052129]|uniref:hypothetical protein n=1 Tax=Nonomuraea sp. NPDC052129 TaxID=3154651 RepID=UPI00343026B3